VEPARLVVEIRRLVRLEACGGKKKGAETERAAPF
jgi:hypothetical protein